MKTFLHKALVLTCAWLLFAGHQGVAQQKKKANNDGDKKKETAVKINDGKADKDAKDKSLQRPKLVVGIVVDQMRYDFLYRYFDKYGDGGFKRLMNDGYSCEQTYYNYMPTYTGPGHTSIYTGTTPAVHGIIANNWYDKKSGKLVYCTQDDSMKTVGSTSAAGKMSPNRMTVTTITDQLQLATNGRSKVIGVALKDRGAILPAGHSADAAYWLDDSSPNWITSSYYMSDEPQWVKTFNAQNKVNDYLSKPWETLYPTASYTESQSDNNAYEGMLPGETTPTFPHDLPTIFKNTNSTAVIRTTPFGNSLTTDFAMAALDGEQLGADSVTDFLCVSYSSTDYVGHTFGPNSIETEDTYLRLDKDLKRLLDALDDKVGLNNVLIFLTADHGVSEVPAYLQSLKIPGTIVNEKETLGQVKSYCASTFGDSLVASFINQQFFFNDAAAAKLKLNRADVDEKVATYVRTLNDSYQVFTANDLTRYEYNHLPARNVQLGYDPQRSGDVVVNYPPHYLEFGSKGTTHGSPYNYDSHVPLLWFGWHVKDGKYYERVNIADAAVTVAAMLHILEPSGATGQVILPLLKK